MFQFYDKLNEILNDKHSIIFPVILDAKQKHLWCKKGEANQKQKLFDYTCD